MPDLAARHTLPDFIPLQRLQNHGFGHRGPKPSPPPSVLSVSHALDGLHPATPSGFVSPR